MSVHRVNAGLAVLSCLGLACFALAAQPAKEGPAAQDKEVVDPKAARRPSAASVNFRKELNLHDRGAPRRLAEPRGARLGRALLRLEVHVHDPEPVAVAGHPLEVVHQAPLEVALAGRRPPSRSDTALTAAGPGPAVP